MGCDGGTIPKRDELVRTKKKPEQKDKTADLDAKWKHCAITQEPLREPIMACELGKLYNKEAVLEFLIDRSKFECASSFEHLKGLKDLKELKLTENKGYGRPKSEKGDSYIDTQDAKYICPVVGITMNGKHGFSYIWSCGCVLSDRALKEVKSDICHKCGSKFTQDDVITLNGTEEEVERLRQRMRTRKEQAKLAKKAKKHKVETSESETKTSDVKKAKTEKVATKTSSKEGASGGPKDKTPNPLSIQKDPKTSATYKSLFTSSNKAKNQQSAHWVTYNPFYN
ncbi:replication termination factor 2 [Magallana gigas]|uniref:replication termination factor 2 n=1 Tax=Magallana gigas TaxID=29159 RepID=UPI00097517D1|eukprot:XP_019920169.1 PREDICTED: protein RTF2 homolog isoform X2 [Crassostrea gigas]